MAIDINNGPAPIKFRKAIDPKEQDEKLHGVAKMYEEQFMREMVKAMRSTVQESGLVQVSQGEKLYREQMDHHNVEQWAKSGGLGLQNIIYQQLVDKYGSKLGIKAALEKPNGPFPMNEKANLQNQFSIQKNEALNSQSSSSNKVGSYKFEKSFLSEQPQELSAAWSGKVLGIQEFNPNEYALEIAHDNGLKSKMVFRGTVDRDLKVNSEVQSGQQVGLLSPEAQAFFWEVSK
jgi:flagellar protein FlgJ